MMNSIQSFASVTLPKTLILLTLLFKLVANQSLSFAVLTSFEHSTLGDNCSAVLQKATNKLKNASLLSSNVSLSCSVIKTECDSLDVLRSFFEHDVAGNFQAVITEGCLGMTEAVAGISHVFNITQLSCTSPSPVLENQEKFPTYFQLLSSITEFVNGIAGLVNWFNWKKVVLFVQQDVEFFTSQADGFKILFQSSNVNYSEYSLSSNTTFENNERIFIILADEKETVQLLCETYIKRGIHGYPSHVFITYQWFPHNWWNTTNSSCTPEQMRTIINGSLAVTHLSATRVVEYDPSRTHEFPIDSSVIEQYCHDAVLTMAYVLDQAFSSAGMDYTSLSQTNSCTTNYFKDTTLRDAVFGKFQNSSFILRGITETGEIRFNENGTRESERTQVFQYRESNGSYFLELVKIGEVVKPNNFSYYSNESVQTVWGGMIPTDGSTQQKFRITTLFLPITIVFSTLSSIGIIFAVICLIFNIVHRNKKVVRVTSPRLNYLIIVGAILFYIDVYFLALPTYDPIGVRLTCNITTWLTVTAYTLCFCTVMAKMFRVYIIFKHPKPGSRKIIKDSFLIAAVITLLCLDILILTTYTTIEQTLDPDSLVFVRPNKEIQNTEGTNYVQYVCDSAVQDVAIGLYYGLKMVLQFIALVLALLTINVKVKGLNDAKYIAAMVYVISIVIVVLAVCEFTLGDRINIFAVIFSTGITIAPTFILVLTFIPTMLRLYRDPQGKSVFMPPQGTSVGDDADVETLRTRVRELEKMLTDQTTIVNSSQRAPSKGSNTGTPACTLTTE